MSAPLGNLNALGNCGGCPPKYKDPAEMQIAIDRYFSDCEGTIFTDKETGEPMLSKYGDPIIIGSKPPTITGLALALGFTSRLALLNYEGKIEFVNTVKLAKARVEEYAETRLFDRDGVNGAKFSLMNNFKGWKDTQTMELTGANGGPIEVNNIQALNYDDLLQLESILSKTQLPEVVDVTKSED
jgi:hypothetical protein